MKTTVQRKPLMAADAEWGEMFPEGWGPVTAEEFESWGDDEDNPKELIGGWVLPMAPGSGEAGRSSHKFSISLDRVVASRNWDYVPDSRHRLPTPSNTIVYPDIAIHAVAHANYHPGTETIGRVPDVIIEILAKRTWRRDVGPSGVKFLAYQMSGVKEYYYTWPDGKDASGYVLKKGVYVPLRKNADGFFKSPLLGCSLRLVPAATR